MERKYEYIGIREKTCDIVICGDDWFDYRKDEDELPKVGAFCKNCAKETAVPIYPIYMNAKPAYALKCSKCGSEYPMYKGTYKSRYIGATTPNGGHINPTHGMISRTAAMDRKAKEFHDSIPQRVEDQMCEMFGYTHEEYMEMKKQWEESDRKRRKEYKNREADIHARFQNERIQKESNNRKELIEKGILKYVKNIGLVNTETGEVVKL